PTRRRNPCGRRLRSRCRRNAGCHCERSEAIPRRPWLIRWGLLRPSAPRNYDRVKEFAMDTIEREARTSFDLARTGPGTLMGRFMRRFWIPVHRAEDLPQGHAKPIRIMSEDFALYR